MSVEFSPESSRQWPILVKVSGCRFSLCVPDAEDMIEQLQEAVTLAYEEKVGLERR